MPEEAQSQSTSSSSGGQSSSSDGAGGGQQGEAQPLPLSPYTGEPFDPEWGELLKKGRGESGIQQILKPDIERKSDK